jgi:hypothetical protein
MFEHTISLSSIRQITHESGSSYVISHERHPLNLSRAVDIKLARGYEVSEGI